MMRMRTEAKMLKLRLTLKETHNVFLSLQVAGSYKKSSLSREGLSAMMITTELSMWVLASIYRLLQISKH